MSKHIVKYTGPTQHTRILEQKVEEKKGILLPSDLQWDLNNRHTLVLEDLDESALEFFNGDPDFSVRELENKDEEPEPKLTKKQQADAKVAEETLGTGGGGSSIGTTAGTGRTTTSTTTATT